MDQSLEEWRPVLGYEDHYQVSSEGNVARIAVSGARTVKKLTVHRGYLVVALWKENSGKTHRVHRLVAQAFIEGDHSLSINHKDGNKQNNRPENLEWVSLAENTRHQWDTGLANPSGCYRPEKVPLEQRAEICRRVLAGERQKDIASDYGCSRPLISWIVRQNNQQVMA